jgi:endoglucanase
VDPARRRPDRVRGAAGETAADWDTKFGNFASSHPVIVTEWTTSTNFYCGANTGQAAGQFLAYLGAHRVGLMAFAWDFSGNKFGSAFQGFPPLPTAYQNLSCGDVGFGPGNKILNAHANWPQ